MATKTLKRSRLVWMSGVLAACLAVAFTALAVGGAEGAPHQSELSQLNAPRTGTDQLPAGVAPTNVDPSGSRLANTLGPVRAYLAPEKDGDRLCLVAVVGQGNDATWGATCNPASVLDNWGAIPLVVQSRDGALFFVGAVRDGFTAIRGEAPFADGKVAGNVAIAPVTTETNGLDLQGSAGSRVLPVGSLVSGSPAR